METKVLWPKFNRTIDGIDGLAVVVVRDWGNHNILMVAFTNEEAWGETLKTREVTLFSTSRGKLWTKGEESGNIMTVIDVWIDCDGDAIVYEVILGGEKLACHTGAPTCFFRNAIHRVGVVSNVTLKIGEKETLEERTIETPFNQFSSLE